MPVDMLHMLNIQMPVASSAAASVGGRSGPSDDNGAQDTGSDSDFGKAIDAVTTRQAPPPQKDNQAAKATKEGADNTSTPEETAAPQDEVPAQPTNDSPKAATSSEASAPEAPDAEPSTDGAAAAALAALLQIANQILLPSKPDSEMGGLPADPNPNPPQAAVHPFLLAAEITPDLSFAVTPAPVQDDTTPQPALARFGATLQALIDAHINPSGAVIPPITEEQVDTVVTPQPAPIVPQEQAPAALAQVQAATVQAMTTDAAPTALQLQATKPVQEAAPVAPKNTVDPLKALRDLLAQGPEKSVSTASNTQDTSTLPVLPAPMLTSFLDASLLHAGDDKDADATSHDVAQGPSQGPSAATPAEIKIASAHTDSFSKLVSATQHGTPAEQVVVQFKTMAATGTNNIRIQLQPADMGKVEVQMSMTTDGTTRVTVTADNRNTLDMLQRDARQLEQALRNIGMNTDTGGLSFNLRGEQQQQQQKFSASSYTQVAALDEDEQDYYAAATQIYRLQPGGGGVDIRV